MNLTPVCCEKCGKLVGEAYLEDGEEFSFEKMLRGGKWLAPFTVDTHSLVFCKECNDSFPK